MVALRLSVWHYLCERKRMDLTDHPHPFQQKGRHMNPINTNPMDEGQINMGNPLDQMPMGTDADSQVQGALDPNMGGLSASDPNVATCPVCGTLVDTRTAQNTLASPVNQQMGTIYFDTARCKADFEQDPQRYGSNF